MAPEPPDTQEAARKKLTGKKQLIVNTVADEEIHDKGAPGGPPGQGASVSPGPACASHPAGPDTPAEARMRRRVRHGQAHRGRTPPPGAARCSQEETESQEKRKQREPLRAALGRVGQGRKGPSWGKGRPEGRQAGRYGGRWRPFCVISDHLTDTHRQAGGERGP